MRLSIVVPLAPGETTWRGLLVTLSARPADSEVIVVVPEDDAVDERAFAGVRVVRAPRGRASQLNAGAAAAGGRWLWLLHADSRLTPGVWPALTAFIDRDRDALGYFDLCFADDGPAWMRLNAFGANLRSRWFGLPFGDQGFVLRADRYARLGGCDTTLARGEDHRLVWQARAAAVPLQRLPAVLVTSARRYGQHGWLRTTAQHLRLTWAQIRAARRALR